jgi:hypothetical protein
MSRRLAGIVLLVLALVAVIVVPSLNGVRLAGSAVPSTFPDPPRVGDCVLPPFPTSPTSSGLPPEIRATAITFGSCAGPHVGEIVSVWPSRAAHDADEATGSARGPCYRQAATFAGLQAFSRSVDPFGAPSDGTVIWRPTIGFDPFHVVPGVRESNAGHSWVGCLAVPTGHRSYEGSLRAVYSTGVMPPSFASCWAGADLDRVPPTLRCDEPHPAELLATGFIRERVKAPTTVIDESCLYIAGRIMRVADPTRGGKLTIIADRLTGDQSSLPDAPLSIGCFVTATGSQQLSGSVIGLGDGPVPFAT